VLHLPTLLLLHLVSLLDLFSLQGLHLLLKHGALVVRVDIMAALQLLLLLSHVVTPQILHLHHVLLLQLLHLPEFFGMVSDLGCMIHGRWFSYGSRLPDFFLTVSHVGCA
jgi:hypothetical protein